MFRNQGYLEKNKKLCTEIISLIIEYLIYGDKQMPQIFEYLSIKNEHILRI